VKGRVSIIIPCWNAGRYLRDAITSCLEQSFDSPTGAAGSSIEIAVIDDGSADDSLAIARGFEPAIHVFSGPNSGVSAARNRGISETGGEWIIFLDADDLLCRGTVKSRLDTADTSGADVIVCDWQELIERDGDVIDGAVKSVDVAALATDTALEAAMNIWAPPAALMYRRSVVAKIGGFRNDLPIIQDARFLFDASFHGAVFAHSPNVGARYRVVPESLSRRDPARFWLDVLTNGKQIEALWTAGGSLSRAQKRILAGLYGNAARGLFASGHPGYFEAAECERKHASRLPLHPRIAVPLARTLGLGPARRVLGMLGR